MRPPLDRAFRTAITVLAGVLAAPFAHVAIDVAGDVLLPHDAFDAVAHGSRGHVLALGAALALALGVRLLWNALRDARGGSRLGRASLERVAAEPLWRAAACIFPIALAGVMVMEGLDLVASGRTVDDPGDLLSGSIPFGLGVTLVCSVLVALAARCVAWFAAATHARVVAALTYLLRARDRVTSAPPAPRPAEVRAPRRGARPVRCSGLRAPPLLLRV